MNSNVKIIEEKLLSDNWYTLKKITFDYRNSSGAWSRQSREAYDRGNGAVILLYNTENQTIISTGIRRVC
jgi:GDP-mannose pyrophosphatase NudK